MDDNVRHELMKKYSESVLFHKRFRHKSRIIFWELFIRSIYFIKRVLDIIISITGMILLSPVFLITMIAVYFEDPGPVFYTQNRVGKNGKHFKFIKFRSMIMNADKIKISLMDENESKDGVTFKMKKDPRITKTGRIIRRFSIDELPQLLNVLIGDMAIVGPRPPVPSEVEEYTLEERKRLHVIPGITCIWQVSGRSDIPFKEQVRLDLEYIRSQSIWSDILIILKTIPAVLTGKGAY
jgi:lipopolysaccharide/colanic/teichoic acid biosynthesis glycosyltransferase